MSRWLRKVSVVLGLSALSLVGCVKKSDYEALQGHRKQDHGTAMEKLKTRDDHIVSLSEALVAEQAKVKQQAAEIEQLKAELQAVNDRYVAQQQQLTEMVKNSAGLKASIQEMQNALNVLREQKRQSEARVAEFKKLLNSFKAMIDAGKLKVKVVNGRMVVELPSDVLFGSGSVDLSEAGKTAIADVGTIFVTMPEREFQVEGHTDNQPIRTARFPSNWELASGRAIAVSQILIKAGVSPSKVSAASFGEFRPVTSNDKPETRAQNRRIEIVLVTDLSKVPGFEELEQAGKN
jgi:chemotaxis protein MotB